MTPRDALAMAKSMQQDIDTALSTCQPLLGTTYIDFTCHDPDCRHVNTVDVDGWHTTHLTCVCGMGYDIMQSISIKCNGGK